MAAVIYHGLNAFHHGRDQETTFFVYVVYFRRKTRHSVGETTTTIIFREAGFGCKVHQAPIEFRLSSYNSNTNSIFLISKMDEDQQRDRSRSRDRGGDDNGGERGGGSERGRGDREEEHPQQKNNDKSNLYITNLNHQVIVFIHFSTTD